MAPRKAAPADKATADNGPELILTYLRTQNRPYSASDISSNLHNKVSKAKADKILKDLHESGKIAGKAAGKQCVYHALQVRKLGFNLLSDEWLESVVLSDEDACRANGRGVLICLVIGCK